MLDISIIVFYISLHVAFIVETYQIRRVYADHQTPNHGATPLSPPMEGDQNGSGAREIDPAALLPLSDV
jgi:hypothetical protein